MPIGALSPPRIVPLALPSASYRVTFSPPGSAAKMFPRASTSTSPPLPAAFHDFPAA